MFYKLGLSVPFRESNMVYPCFRLAHRSHEHFWSGEQLFSHSKGKAYFAMELKPQCQKLFAMFLPVIGTKLCGHRSPQASLRISRTQGTYKNPIFLSRSQQWTNPRIPCRSRKNPATSFGKASSSHPLEHALLCFISKNHVQMIHFLTHSTLQCRCHCAWYDD